MLSTARLAQSVERKALNLVVVGSRPTVGAYISRGYLLAHIALMRQSNGEKKKKGKEEGASNFSPIVAPIPRRARIFLRDCRPRWLFRIFSHRPFLAAANALASRVFLRVL